MDSESLPERWRLERAEAESYAAVSREDLLTMVQVRANEVAARMRRRLREEIFSYLIILAILLPSMQIGFRPGSLGIAAGLVFALSGVMVALHVGWRRLAVLDLQDTAGETLRRTIHIVDATMRYYMIAYMACILMGALAIVTLVVYKHPGDLRWIVLCAVLSAVAIAWSYQGGRGYLHDRFGAYRDELARCLSALEEPGVPSDPP